MWIQKIDRVIITPRGPDPILLGIRGESAEIVKKAFGILSHWSPWNDGLFSAATKALTRI